MKKQNEMKLPESYVDMNAQETASTASGNGLLDSSSSDEILFDLGNRSLDSSEIIIPLERSGLDLPLKTPNSIESTNTQSQAKASGMEKAMGWSMVLQSGTGLISGMTQYIKSTKKS